MTLTYGELCAGYGGLFEGVRSVLGGDLAWYSEFDPAPSKVMAHHHPGVPNIGDMTKVDWHSVPKVDVLSAGYPCQPFSFSGRRAGVNDDRHLWPNVAEAVAVLRPSLCIFENVRGHLSLGFDEVLRDLKQLNYTTRWYTLRAADIGAPHGRARLFIFAEDANGNHSRVCSRANRRRGHDRHLAHDGEHVHAASRHRDGHEVVGDPGGHATPLGWAHGQDEAGDGKPRAEGPLDAGERPGGGVLGGDRSAPHPEEGAGGCRNLPDAAGEREPSHTGPAALDGRGPREVGDPETEDARAERSGAGEAGAGTAGREATSGVPLGSMVGAGRRPVRASGVPGQPSDERAHGCWPCVRQALMGRADGERGTFATPADASGFRPDEVPADRRLAGVEVPASDGDSGRVGLTLLPTPVSDNSRGLPSSGTDYQSLPNAVVSNWGDYGPAIARWEALTRPAPAPTEPGAKGSPRLSPRFVEFLMGLPEGHVTDPAIGLTRNQQLKALGNGVVPAQSAAATRAFIHDLAKEPAA